MIENLKSIYPFFIFISIVFILMAIILFLITFKYKKWKLKILAIFASLSTRNIILLSSIIFNFLIVVYFSIGIKYYSEFVTYLIIVNNVLCIITALNFHFFISNILYSIISIFSLKIVSLIYNYLSCIYYNRITFILGCIFVGFVIFYELFITVRQLEIVVNYNQKRKIKKEGNNNESK